MFVNQVAESGSSAGNQTISRKKDEGKSAELSFADMLNRSAKEQIGTRAAKTKQEKPVQEQPEATGAPREGEQKNLKEPVAEVVALPHIPVFFVVPGEGAAELAPVAQSNGQVIAAVQEELPLNQVLPKVSAPEGQPAVLPQEPDIPEQLPRERVAASPAPVQLTPETLRESVFKTVEQAPRAPQTPQAPQAPPTTAMKPENQPPATGGITKDTSTADRLVQLGERLSAQDAGEVKNEQTLGPMTMSPKMENESQTVKINDSSSLIQRQVAEQLTDTITARLGEDVRQFEMTLHPQRLGQVVVKMIFEAGRLVVHVETSNMLAQNLLTGNTAELKNALAQNGLQAADIYITYSGEEGRHQGENGRQFMQEDGRKQGRAFLTEELAEEEEEVLLDGNELDYSI